MAEKLVGRTTAAQLIAELQKLPPDAEVVTSIYGWEGDELGPVTVIEQIKVIEDCRHVVPAIEQGPPGRTVYVLDTPG